MSPPAKVAAALALLASTCGLAADAFAHPFGAGPTRAPRFGRFFAPKAATSTAEERAVAVPPSWEELSDALAAKKDASGSPEEEPLVTLYRDTNGWCPFCERVWVILRAKGIPYKEQLISLQNKPEWYKALVPTTLVPAVLFHGSDEGEEKKNERRIVWESADIVEALDEAFPETPRMILNTPEYEAAVKMNDDLTSAGFGFVYAGRNDTLSDADKAERKAAFLAELDRLDAALEEQQKQVEGGKPCFRLGEEFTAADALMVPTLERWRYQLPLTVDVDVLDGRPALSRWFDAMDSYEPYAGRVRGDRYSWTATNSMFLRYFGGGEERPDVARAIQRADDAAAQLAGSFATEGGAAAGAAAGKAYAEEAAAKLVANHDAVVTDCTREDPASQRHVGRAPDPTAADVVLRHVAGLLLSEEEDAARGARVAPLPDMGDARAEDGAAAARIVAARLCVPRDMGAPAAGILRAALAAVADRLEE